MRGRSLREMNNCIIKVNMYDKWLGTGQRSERERAAGRANRGQLKARPQRNVAAEVAASACAKRHAE